MPMRRLVEDLPWFVDIGRRFLTWNQNDCFVDCGILAEYAAFSCAPDRLDTIIQDESPLTMRLRELLNLLFSDELDGSKKIDTRTRTYPHPSLLTRLTKLNKHHTITDLPTRMAEEYRLNWWREVHLTPGTSGIPEVGDVGDIEDWMMITAGLDFESPTSLADRYVRRSVSVRCGGCHYVQVINQQIPVIRVMPSYMSTQRSTSWENFKTMELAINTTLFGPVHHTAVRKCKDCHGHRTRTVSFPNPLPRVLHIAVSSQPIKGYTGILRPTPWWSDGAPITVGKTPYHLVAISWWNGGHYIMTARFGFSDSDDEEEAMDRWKLYDDMNDKGALVDNEAYGSRLPSDDRETGTYLYTSSGKPRKFGSYRPRMFHFVTRDENDASRIPDINDVHYVVRNERFNLTPQCDLNLR